ncbi:girdin-like isoform X2 [Saccostrea cucullata]|uniref:girdin-like isoform X2 n=2 Tax=Saccostrea cuccullata TaxID=36930 RepID=UPI002ED2528A
MLFLHLLLCWMVISMSTSNLPLAVLKSEEKPITVVCANESVREDIHHLKQQLSQETLIRLSLVHQMSAFVNELLTVKKEMASVLVKMEEVEKGNADIQLEKQRMRMELDRQIKINNTDRETLQENTQHHKDLQSAVEEIFRNYTAEFRTEEITEVKNDMSEILDKIQELENNVTDLELENQRLQRKLDENIIEKEKEDDTKLQMIKELQEDFRNVTTKIERTRPEMLPSFHARLSRPVRKIGLSQTVIFDLEVVDTTNSYDPQSGIFTAPVTGTYVFYWNILSNEASGMDTALDSSQGALGCGFVSHAVNYGNGGNLVLANLTSGTHVWVKKADKFGNYIHERFSTFSGYLLQASG